MIVDSHHHLWDPGRRRHARLIDPSLAPINRTYTLDDFVTALSDQIHGAPALAEPPWLRLRLVPAPSAIRTILVQDTTELAETRELLATAEASRGLVAGVIGWVDLRAPDVADQIDLLRASPGGRLLVGLRHPVDTEADPEWLCRPEVLRGLRLIGELGLVFDLLVTVDHLAVAREVATRVPEMTFVLNHLGGPPIAAGAWQPWAGRLTALAQLPNVCAKLAGLVTADRWQDWETEHILPYTMHAFQEFGADRVMYGSDWPVCTLAAGYAETLAVAEQCSAHLSPPERRAFFSENARRVYHLGPPAG